VILGSALVGALCTTVVAATGFTNKRLRALVAGLLGTPYRPGQMTYGLRRLRRHGLIQRIPRTNRELPWVRTLLANSGCW
jgi:hypothetical protein